MKKVSALALSATIMFSAYSAPTVSAANDISGHWAESEIRSLVGQKIIEGYRDGSFRPNKELTRAEFTALLVRTLDLKLKDSSIRFSDVPAAQWYADDIKIAASNQLVQGYKGEFNPTSYITREDMALMISRSLDYKEINAFEETISFTDKSKINTGQEYQDSIGKLVFLDILNGFPDGSFKPKNAVKRGDTAAILDRMINIFNNPKVVISSVNYNHNFNSFVSKQMTRTPKADGAGIYLASKSMVNYYANPSNFDKNSSEYYQFLDLSKTSGISATEINKNILTNTGTLTNQGQAFIDAGKAHGVNEIYLIAHALHETGNGRSTLASGIPVDSKGNVVVDKNGDMVSKTDPNYQSKIYKIVYNFFGYGAHDSNPLRGGAKYAFDRGWFSPQAAIKGGASEIVKNYIAAGQNSLYKMRWNPDNPGQHQYATHTMWAVSQTTKMSTYYDKLSRYILKYDVPKYVNQPGKTAKPTGASIYHVDSGFVGKNGSVAFIDKTSQLNFREGPTTFFSSIAKLNYGAPVKINGENGGWLNITSGSKTGWVSGEYVDIAVEDSKLSGALGSVNVTNVLNLRKAPSTKFNILDELPNNTPVIIHGQTGNWLKVQTDKYIGWAYKPYINVNMTIASTKSTQTIETPEPITTKLGTTDSLVLLTSSPTSATVVAEIAGNTPVTVMESSGDKVKISFQDQIGWANANKITIHNEG